MKKQNPHDERIVAQRRKVNSEAFGILMIVLLASVLVQQFVFHAPLEQYAVELICFIGMSLYIVIRYVTIGVNIYGDGKRAKYIPLINSVVVGIVVTLVNGFFNYSQYSEHYKADGIGYFFAVLGITFFCSFISAFVLLSFVSYLNKKKQAQIQKQLDNDEQDNED